MKSHPFLTAAVGLAGAVATIVGATAASANMGPAPQYEYIHILSASAASGASTVIATGVFTAGGVATGNLANGGTDVVTLPGGTFKVSAGKARGSGSSSAITCLSAGTASGVYKIHSGTGKYAHISGSGRFSYSYMSVSAHTNGHCGKTTAAETTINLQGPAST